MSSNDWEYMDDGAWAGLFEMAEGFEEEPGVGGIPGFIELPAYPDDSGYPAIGEKDGNRSPKEWENSGWDSPGFVEMSAVSERSFSSPEEALKVLFGYDSFRPGQREVIDSILSGRDTFAVMPTGSGKSVCYQIPAMLLPGITLVISPLISLMQDQVKALNEAGVPAAFINSSLTANDMYATLHRAREGAFKLIYVAPERLVTDSFLEMAREVRISMVTVDEAHCISQWGQDFRPSYMRIVEFVRLLEDRPILSAFTATATEAVREDVVCTLGLEKPFVLVTGFDRENLFFQVEKPKNKEQYILDYIGKHPGDSGIIYCATRKNVDNLYILLESRGISVARYHAGMGAEARKKMQDDFVFDNVGIIVATNAFGMGIDKSNVRFVIHYNMPQSMENYYQEAGRAGRDGLDAACILLFSPQDVIIDRFLLERKEMSDLDPEVAEIVRERDTQRLRTMERYCYTTECLRNYILKYFGEEPTEPCEDCGNCLRRFETLDMTEAARQIVNCVYEARGRYGRNIIIDTVAGAKTARLAEVGAMNYRTYGVLSSTNRNLLKRLVEQMIAEGYLQVGDYQVLRMGDISRLKDPENIVAVKITEEDKLPERAAKTKKTVRGTEALTSAGFKLFDRLRSLRFEIAREERIPPYIIFSDKTLIDMAVRVPVSEDEMLAVSGVGKSKSAKYGERFLRAIEECAEEYPELLRNKVPIGNGEQEEAESVRTAAKDSVSDSASDPARGSAERRKSKSRKTVKEEFSLLPEEAAEFCYAEYRNINEIRDEMNRICLRDNVRKLPAVRMTEILEAEGLLRDPADRRTLGKVPTEKGLAAGILEEQRTSEKGNAYTIPLYPEHIQRMLVEHYVTK